MRHLIETIDSVTSVVRMSCSVRDALLLSAELLLLALCNDVVFKCVCAVLLIVVLF